MRSLSVPELVANPSSHPSAGPANFDQSVSTVQWRATIRRTKRHGETADRENDVAPSRAEQSRQEAILCVESRAS